VAQGCHVVVNPRASRALLPMLHSLPRCQLAMLWVPCLLLGACGGTVSEDAPRDAVFVPTSMATVPSHRSKFQLQAELGITAFTLDSRSQSRVADSFGSHLHIVEAVLASFYGYSVVRATGILLTAEPVCARPAPEEVDASLVISFVAEGQGSALPSKGGLTEAISEAMRDVDGGISVLTSCVSYLSWAGSGGSLPEVTAIGEGSMLQDQIGGARSRTAAVVCLQLAACTVSCFVLTFVLMQCSRVQQFFAALVGQELVPADAEQVAPHYRDCDSSDLEASIASSCQRKHEARLDSGWGSESTATQTPNSLESDTEISPLPSRSPDCFSASGLQSEQSARYL